MYYLSDFNLLIYKNGYDKFIDNKYFLNLNSFEFILKHNFVNFILGFILLV